MKVIEVKVSGFRGPEYMRLPATGEKVKLLRDAEHGDWKTAAVRPGHWPTIKKGTEVEVLGWMQNMEGVHLKVKYLDWAYDVPDYFFDKNPWR